MKRECETCIKRKTTFCPTSMECMATDDMPYYQNRIMLLEENQKLNGAIQTYEILLKANVEENKQLKDNWNKLKEFMQKEYDDLDKYSIPAYGCAMGEIKRIKNKMQELESGNSDEYK